MGKKNLSVLNLGTSKVGYIFIANDHMYFCQLSLHSLCPHLKNFIMFIDILNSGS